MRLELGQTVTVRFRAYSDVGLVTHWDRKRSHFCKGEDCPARLHSLETYWKGYAPVDVWGEQSGKWFPWVLEITEALELDFRGVAARGQVWELHRPTRSKGRRASVTGTIVEQLDPAKVPDAFDVLPILRTVFHEPLLALKVKNPMPARVVMQPLDGDAPANHKQQADQGKGIPNGFSFVEELKKRARNG